MPGITGPDQDLFYSLAPDIAPAFLTACPTPHAAARLGDGPMPAFLRRHSYRGGESPALLLQRLRAEDGPDPGVGEDRVERGGEVGAAVADHELDAVRMFAEVHDQVASLLGGPRPGGMLGDAEEVLESGVAIMVNASSETAYEFWHGTGRIGENNN
jgi:hypothetical protein